MTSPAEQPEPRIPLTRARVLRAAIELADAEGLEAVTMRNLAAHLGVEAMSLYHHVANKEALLDGIVDTLVGDIESELGGFDFELEPGGWQATLRTRSLAARSVMLRHRWAPSVIETRTMTTPMILRYMDSIIGIMLAGGLSSDLCHHASHALGSLPLGFNRELFAPTDAGDDRSSETMNELAAELPHIVRMLGEVVVHDDPDTTIGWCDDQTEFEFALDLLLDGLALRFEAERKT